MDLFLAFLPTVQCSSYPHVDLNVGDFSFANSALVVFDTGMNHAIMLEHFSQGVESVGAIRTFVVLDIRSMALSMSVHAFRFSSPKRASPNVTVQPLIIRGFKAKIWHVVHV